MGRSWVFVVVGLLMALAGAAHAESPTTHRVDEPRFSKAFFEVERTAKPLPTEEPELPWLWVQIREAVNATEKRLPHHQEKDFYIVLSPTRVSNGFDTVAGLGVSGHF